MHDASFVAISFQSSIRRRNPYSFAYYTRNNSRLLGRNQ